LPGSPTFDNEVMDLQLRTVRPIAKPSLAERHGNHRRDDVGKHMASGATHCANRSSPGSVINESVQTMFTGTAPFSA
jgi:hypothetical protein